ncbi:hypothetical protein [uncultured Streptomyces sp.]|uniref:hypothetical protein n=1 Tax=uncultured Streptomyces sp. TaxID=174707 RepID=UPI002636C374|nr:hypothetical protein [uncultured Streptomyces sp.]
MRATVGQDDGRDDCLMAGAEIPVRNWLTTVPARPTDKLVGLVEGIARGDTPATSLLIIDPVRLALIGADR